MPFYQLIVTTTARKHYFSFEIACITGGLAGSNAKHETAREALDEIFFRDFSRLALRTRSRVSR